MPEDIKSRREFVEAVTRCAAAAGAGCLLASSPFFREILSPEAACAAAGQPLEEILRQAPVARFWLPADRSGKDCSSCHPPLAKGAKSNPHGTDFAKCQLCAHACLIKEGERGKCRARYNSGGKLRSLVYGRPITEHVDPIEKKPFYHFLPGSEAYSLATSGCPFRCKFCQNWEISQARPEDYSARFCPPEEMARRAKGRNSPVIAFTYNEPTVFAEYLIDIARSAKKSGIRSVIISCGFMQEAPLAEMIEVLDGIKIDLKGFSPEFYEQVSSAKLDPVLRSIKQVAKAGRHLEIVNLVVPTLNDSPKMLDDLSKWIAGEIGPDVPVHFTRFHPEYQLLNLPPTPVSSIERAREAAMKHGIRYAYVGNVPGHPGNNTYCPKCGKACIERSGFFVTKLGIKGGKCASCGTKIAGVWE